MDVATLSALAKEGGLLLYSVVVTFAAIRLWSAYRELQDKVFDVQQVASKELREMQAASMTTIAANATALQAATTAMQAVAQQGRAQ